MKVTKLTVGALATNCYIIANENLRHCAVIDPGDDFEKIMMHINSNKLKVTEIVLTHCHIDHVGALDELKLNTNAKIIASSIDKDSLNSDNYTLASMLGKNAPVSKIDVLVNDGDIISVAGYTAKIISTPGHTPGSICIYFNEHNSLFSGDTLFYESIGRTDFPGGSFKSICNSIKNKLYLLDKNTVVYPGHNSTTTIQHEIESNFYI